MNCGSIEQRYLDNIIMQLQYYGPYMFLNDSVLLAHAKPEDGVNALDVAISVFKDPILFSGERKAKVIIVLAAEDQEKHLTILQDILEIVSDEKILESIIESNTEMEVFGTIKQNLNSEGRA